jgi:uncharacterized integral membrane protein
MPRIIVPGGPDVDQRRERSCRAGVNRQDERMSDQRETERGREVPAPDGYTAPSPADGPTRPAAPGVARPPQRPGGPREAVTEPSVRRPSGLRPARRGARPGRTRLSGTWVGLILGALVLVFLLVFVVQNLAPAEVAFLGWRATLPLGVWLLFAAVAGVLLLAIPGLGRMLQWRRASGTAGVRR